jgi:hypothetical protein
VVKEDMYLCESIEIWSYISLRKMKFFFLISRAASEWLCDIFAMSNVTWKRLKELCTHIEIVVLFVYHLSILFFNISFSTLTSMSMSFYILTDTKFTCVTN